MVWRSQYNGGQKCERRERPVRIAPDVQRMSMLYQNLVARLSFIHITYLRHFKTSKRNSSLEILV